MNLQTSGFFSAAHKLENYEGKCNQLHGHTWAYLVVIKEINLDKLKSNGISFDFGTIKKKLDHVYINDVITENPTAENIALCIKGFIENELNKDGHKGIRITVRLWEDITKLINVKDLEDGRGEYIEV